MRGSRSIGHDANDATRFGRLAPSGIGAPAHVNGTKSSVVDFHLQLAHALDRNAFKRLVIVAPPVALGDLRAAISHRVRATVIGELARDLTKIPNGEVAEHLKGLLAV